MNYTLQLLNKASIEKWAWRYVMSMTPKDRAEECRIDLTVSPATRNQGFYSRDDLVAVCVWKSSRRKTLPLLNDAQSVREVTTLALSTQLEWLRIESLTLLDGVEWATASALLHFGHRDRYPIMDVNALWSLTISEPPSYKFSFWSDYVQICRDLATHYDISMRLLDRLYQYGKENRPADLT
jgi:hypothetical protein